MFKGLFGTRHNVSSVNYNNSRSDTKKTKPTTEDRRDRAFHSLGKDR